MAKLPIAHNFTRNSGYFSTWNHERVKTWSDLTNLADEQNISEFLVLNDVEVNFMKWKFTKVAGVWKATLL
jgi:hypothetical protein